MIELQAVNEATNDAITAATINATQWTISSILYAADRRIVWETINFAVGDVVEAAVDRAIDFAVYEATRDAAYAATRSAVWSATDVAVDTAIRRATFDATQPIINDALTTKKRSWLRRAMLLKFFTTIAVKIDP